MTDESRQPDTPSDAEPLPFDLAELLASTPGLLRRLRGGLPTDGQELDEELAALQAELGADDLSEDDVRDLVDDLDLDRDIDIQGLLDGAFDDVFDGDGDDLLGGDSDTAGSGDDTANSGNEGSKTVETDGGVNVDDETITVEGETIEEEYTAIDEKTGEVIDDDAGEETADTTPGAAQAGAASGATESGSTVSESGATGSTAAEPGSTASESGATASEPGSTASDATGTDSADSRFPSRSDFGVRSREGSETPSDDDGSEGGSWQSRGRSLRALLARIGGSAGVAAATIVGFEGLTYAVGKFIPAYLLALDASPVIVGLYGTLMIATAGLTATASSNLPDSGLVERSIALVAATGLALWALAPSLSTIVPIPAWAPVLAGGVLVGTLGAIADTPVDLVEGPHARRPTPTRRSLRRTGGILAGLAIVAVLMSAASSVQVALQVALVLAAALGVTVAAFPEPDEPDERTVDLPGVLNRDASKPIRQGDATASTETAVTPDETAVTIEQADAQQPTGRFGSGISSLSSGARALLLGETLIDAALALTMVFVVVVATRVLAVSIAGFGPYVVFTALVAIERVAGLVASRVGPSLANAAGPGAPAIVGGILAAVFPLLLISAPANAIVVGFAFGLFGLRFVATDARERLRQSVTGHADRKTTRMLRAGVLIVSPLLGGVLYQLSPVLAFGVATTIGVLGVRELVRAASEIDYLDPVNT